MCAFVQRPKKTIKQTEKKSMMIQMGLVRVFRETQVASNDVLEQAHTGISDQSGDHVGENVGNSEETLGGLADVIKSGFIN
jgi:hypothetical protein